MTFLLGALVAILAALLVMPAIFNRAVRLTTRRVEAAVPSSAREIHADMDLQRANFALHQHRLETQMDALRERMMTEARLSEDHRQRADALERALEDKTLKLAQAREALAASAGGSSPTVAPPPLLAPDPFSCDQLLSAAAERETAVRLELDALRLEFAAFKAAAGSGDAPTRPTEPSFATDEDVALVRQHLAQITARMIAQASSQDHRDDAPRVQADPSHANLDGPK